MASLGDRLREAMTEMGLSEGELARRAGLKQPTIHRILTGQSKDPRQGNVEKIAAVIGQTATWLRTGKGKSIEGANNVHKPAGAERFYRYPIISWVAAGGWSEAVTPYPPGSEQSYESTDYKSKGDAFWLEVMGDSMTAPVGLSIPQGMYILVDTGVEAANGSLIVAQLSDSDEATFKKLVIDGGRRFLKPLNPAYPIIPINGDCHIVGVVTEAKMKIGHVHH